MMKIDEMVGNFSMSIKIKELRSEFEWWFTSAYGPCRPQHQSEFWSEPLVIKSIWGGSWVIRDDFNVIRFTHEKNRPNHITRSMRDFDAFVNQCDLRDSPLLHAKIYLDRW